MSSILVIDDEVAILKFFGEILEEGGYAVHTASSGLEGLKILREVPVDLVVLDLSMPEPDGFELLTSIRASLPGLRIIVVSGFMEGALLEAARVLGATAALSKVDAPRLLLQTVRNILQGSRLGES